VAFWKTEAARTAAATSKKFAVTLVEKLVEADEEGTETEDDTTSSIILPRKIVPAAAAAAAAAAAPPHSPARVGSSAAPQAGLCRQHSIAQLFDGYFASDTLLFARSRTGLPGAVRAASAPPLPSNHPSGGHHGYCLLLLLFFLRRGGTAALTRGVARVSGA
jgi:hypothetical protein